MTDGPGFYYAEVLTTERLSTNLVRIVFGGEDLRRYVPIGAGDESVAIYFPGPGEDRPIPMQEKDGVWAYWDDATRPEGRNYTVRYVDPDTSTLTVDFVAHEGGVAASWALAAQPGNVVTFTQPRSWHKPPTDSAWQLLVADLTGLPALARIVEELDEAEKVIAVVEVIAEEDLDCLPRRENVDLHTLIGSGNGHGPSRLAERALSLALPEGDGYVWFAGEASESRTVRKHLRSEHRLPADRFDVIGYWRVNSEKWLEKFEPISEEMLKIYSEALEEGKTAKEASEIYDVALEKAGL